MKLTDKLLAKLGPDFKPSSSSRFLKAVRSHGVPDSSELRRILALPRRALDLNMAAAATALWRTAERCSVAACSLCQRGPAALWPIQAAALIEASQADGLLAPIGVGHGKTLISLLLADAMNAKRIVLLVPPQLRDQLRTRMIPEISRHWKIPLIRGSDTAGDTGGIHLVAYSELSVESGADILERIGPDLIVADEAHNLRHRTATRTKRFLRYFKNHPETRLCAMSGTLTSKSIKDYQHLSELALRKNSPLPNDYMTLQDWSLALDVGIDEFLRLEPWHLTKLCNPDETVRNGFRRRLVESLGVVATEEGALGTSLTIEAQKPILPMSVIMAMSALADTWSIADEELDSPLALARVTRQMALGFYYRWDWPNGEPDHEWLEARAAWHKEVRGRLRHSIPGQDSPLLLARAAASRKWDSEAWPAWALVKDRPQPPTIPIWIDSEWLVQFVHNAIWDQSSIVWYEHDAIGSRLASALKLPHFRGGDDAALLQQNGKKPIICSIKAHGTGKNLQAFSRSLVLSPSSSGALWEQLLGRTHRPGQAADEVVCDVLVHEEIYARAFSGALEDARYIEETTGQKQKLNYATRINF